MAVRCAGRDAQQRLPATDWKRRLTEVYCSEMTTWIVSGGASPMASLSM